MSKIVMAWAKPFARDRSGATAIEYAVMAALLSIILLLATTQLGQNLVAAYTRISTSLPT